MKCQFYVSQVFCGSSTENNSLAGLTLPPPTLFASINPLILYAAMLLHLSLPPWLISTSTPKLKGPSPQKRNYQQLQCPVPQLSVLFPLSHPPRVPNLEYCCPFVLLPPRQIQLTEFPLGFDSPRGNEELSLAGHQRSAQFL